VGQMMMNDSVSAKDAVTHITKRRILWIHMTYFGCLYSFSMTLCQCDVKEVLSNEHICPQLKLKSDFHSMRYRIYVTVQCPSVCLSHQSVAAVACLGFAAGRPAGRRYRSMAGAGAQQQRRRSMPPRHDAQQQMRAMSRLQPP